MQDFKLEMHYYLVESEGFPRLSPGNSKGISQGPDELESHSISFGLEKLKILNRKSQTRFGCIHRSPRDFGGFTLVEVMLSVAIIIVVALGTLCFQYQGVKHSRTAEAQITATRLGQLLLEDWKSTSGDPDYDPVALDMGFASPASPNLGYYRITLDNQTFFIQLAQSEIDHDDVAGVRLSRLSVTTKWRRDFATRALDGDDPTITLTTYIRRD